MSNFWEKLNKPFFCLAPMIDVTDFAFREMFAKYSSGRHSETERSEGEESQKRDPSAAKKIQDDGLRMTPNNFVMYTEFVNVDGLTHPDGYKKLSHYLKYSEAQRPIVAQIWGRSPIKFEEAAKIVASLGFDGVDINFGCPQDKEVAQKTCAALIHEPELAKEIIAATKRGAGQLPVSVKTRIGYSKIEEFDEWFNHLLQAEPAAIALHARTKQEKSKVPAHWDAIKRAVEIRDQTQLGKQTLVIGNGDIKSHDEGLDRIRESGCDGVMVGRGVFGNPWFFHPDNYQPTTKERLSVMLEHARLYNQEFEGAKSFAIMRKHFKAYASGFDGAHELRAKLMEAKDLAETENIVEDFLKNI